MIKPPYSYSHLALYDGCAFKHNLQRILEVHPAEPQDTKAADRGTMLHEACEAYITGEVEIIPTEIAQFKPVLDKLRKSGAKCEVRLACTEDMQPCEYDDPDAFFYGVIDTLELGELVMQVGDWKSGKKRDYSSQLSFYAMLVLINYPKVKTVMTRIRYLDLAVSTPGFEHGRRGLPALFDKWKLTVSRMVKDKIRSPTPGDHCKWCPYNAKKMGICKWGG